MRLRSIGIGVAAVLLFDLIASAASRAFGFPYARAAVGSYVIYLLIGLIVARSAASNPVREAARAAATAGLADASLGWAISWHVGPGRLPPSRPLSAVVWVGVAAFVVALAAAIGTIGALIGRSLRPAVDPVP